MPHGRLDYLIICYMFAKPGAKTMAGNMAAESWQKHGLPILFIRLLDLLEIIPINNLPDKAVQGMMVIKKPVLIAENKSLHAIKFNYRTVPCPFLLLFLIKQCFLNLVKHWNGSDPGRRFRKRNLELNPSLTFKPAVVRDIMVNAYLSLLEIHIAPSKSDKLTNPDSGTKHNDKEVFIA